jgi:hypothetical protein
LLVKFLNMVYRKDICRIINKNSNYETFKIRIFE